LHLYSIRQAGSQRHTNNRRVHLSQQSARGGRGKYLIVRIKEAKIGSKDQR
jgi:hypothetical protein